MDTTQHFRDKDGLATRSRQQHRRVRSAHRGPLGARHRGVRTSRSPRAVSRRVPRGERGLSHRFAREISFHCHRARWRRAGGLRPWRSAVARSSSTSASGSHAGRHLLHRCRIPPSRAFPPSGDGGVPCVGHRASTALSWLRARRSPRKLRHDGHPPVARSEARRQSDSVAARGRRGGGRSLWRRRRGVPIGYPVLDIEVAPEEWEIFATVDRSRGDSLLGLCWFPDAPPDW